MARKAAAKSSVTKSDSVQDITKIPELTIVKSANKITADSDDEMNSGREEGEKDQLIAKASALPQKFTNSSLVSYTKLSPNCTKPRDHVIDTITIHCMAGNLTVESCGNLFASADRQASSNYGVGSDGRIGLYVNECDRSWCSSSRENDMRAVTIEVANDGGQVDNNDSAANWHVSDAAMKSLINLVADICKRNNIKSLKWQNNKSLIGQVDKQNMTVHRWFKAKACPGGYLMSKMSYIADSVNKKLGTSPSAAPVASKTTYRVRKSWDDSKSQIGAYSILNNAIAKAQQGGSVYKVYDGNGNQVYPEVANEMYRIRTSWADEKSQVGAYRNLDSAIQVAKSKGSQYKVFNNSGNMVYPTVVAAAKPASSEKLSPAVLETRPDYQREQTYKALTDFNVYQSSGALNSVKRYKHIANDPNCDQANEIAVFKAGSTLQAKRLSYFDNGDWWMECELGWVKIWDESTHTALFM